MAVRWREMMNEVLDPAVVRVTDRWRSVAPARIDGEQLARPIGDVEWRIGENVIGLEVRVQVAQKRIGWLAAEVRLDATNSEVHMCQSPGGGVGLLAEDGD